MDRTRLYERLVREHGADMYRTALWLCRDPALAEDLVQEAFARAWKSLDRLRDPSSARAWLLTIIRREHARLYQRKRLELVNMDDVVLESGVDADPARQARLSALRQAIANLDDKYRIPLVLQVFGGYSCNEIARELGISPSAVMTQLFRARRKLRSALEDDEDDNGGVVRELF